MAYTIQNNFLHLKAEFKKDTGLDANAANMPLYIAYIHARAADTQMQLVNAILHEMANLKK